MKSAIAFSQLKQEQIALKTSYDQNKISLQEYNSQNAILQAQLEPMEGIWNLLGRREAANQT